MRKRKQERERKETGTGREIEAKKELRSSVYRGDWGVGRRENREEKGLQGETWRESKRGKLKREKGN